MIHMLNLSNEILPAKEKRRDLWTTFLSSFEVITQVILWVNWGGKKRVRGVSSEHFGAEDAELNRFGKQMHVLITKVILRAESWKNSQIKLIL